jgi:hypothetical protein
LLTSHIGDLTIESGRLVKAGGIFIKNQTMILEEKCHTGVFINIESHRTAQNP